MATINSGNKSTRLFSAHPHHHTTCTRVHQLGALALVAATFFLTRLFDHSLGPCSSSYSKSFSEANHYAVPNDVVPFGGYGTNLNLKIYVYDEDEIDGLKLLVSGRYGKISADACVKGQWGTQLESPVLKFSGPEKLGRADYFQHLRNAKFCLAPRGESSWTLRFYESFFVECVPVILSDKVELPFQDVVDYAQISIKWPSTLIEKELLDYLESIPDSKIEEMIERGRKVRCLWVYASESESESCSAFKGILGELQKKVRRFHHSAETFWLHNGSIVNRELVEFSKWKLPVPLP